jgi:hypothetical protein
MERLGDGEREIDGIKSKVKGERGGDEATEGG